MNKLSMKRTYQCATLCALALVVLSACGKASERQNAGNAPYATPPGYQTVCVDRVLVDVPETVEIGATRAIYNGAYRFDGIEGANGWGELSWGNVAISETVPTTEEGYMSVYHGVRGTVISSPEHKGKFEEEEEDIEHWTMRAKSGTPGEIASAKNILLKKKMALEASRHGFRVSGETKLADPHAFAFRRSDEFSTGYLDTVDQRIRTFDGKRVSHLELESPEAAAEEYRRFRRIYHRRLPTDIPTTPGYCTAFGVIDEPGGPEPKTSLRLPFRSLKYPNLIFVLTLSPAEAGDNKNIQKVPNMGIDGQMQLLGGKNDFGPVKETILGAPGRTFGLEYGPNCSATSCRPADQAYEIEAETYGVAGRPDQPHLILHLTAATSDDYRLKLPAQPDDPSYNTPSRPALSGKVPPPFKEGKKIFAEVLHSIRLRPGAIAAAAAVAGAPAAPSQAQKK